MNGGAYGGDFAAVLERALVATSDGSGWLTPAELGLSYRHSELRHGQVVLRAELRLQPRPSDEIKAEVRELNRRRKEAQPTNRRTFGSVFKNPAARAERGPDARGVRPQGSPRRRRADLAEARELHRERRRRHDCGRARTHGRGASPCARAVRRQAPSTRSSSSARSRCPSCRKVRTGAENRKMPARARLARSIARVEALPRPSRPSLPAIHARAWLAHVAPTRRSLAIGLGVLAVALGGYLIARESPLFAIDRIEVTGASPQVAGQVRQALDVTQRPASRRASTVRRCWRTVDALPTVVSASYDRAFPHTLRITVVPGAPRGRPAPRLRQLARVDARARDGAPRGDGAADAAADLDLDAYSGADRRRAHARPVRPRPRTPSVRRMRSAPA